MEELRGKQSVMVEGEMWHLCGQMLYAERRIVVPKKKVMEVVAWQHNVLGHQGIKGTTWELHRRFKFPLTNKELATKVEEWVKKCQVCALVKPNTAADRGTLGCLPLPSMVNTVVYLDLIEVDKNYDNILVAICGLSRFMQAWPCTKKVTGEGSLKIFFERWISVFGAPLEVHHDNDVRWSSETGLWKGVLRSLGVRVSMGVPRRPESNGVAEKANDNLLKTIRT